MGFYDMGRRERADYVHNMREALLDDFRRGDESNIRRYFSDDDGHVRQKAYLAAGRLYKEKRELRENILKTLHELSSSKDEKVRQTVVHCYSEIGMITPDEAVKVFETALADGSWKVRNSVVGSLKVIGEKNPDAAIGFANSFLRNPDPRIRKAVLHGLELRGRTHPQDILPVLEKAQFDSDREVRETLVHVLSQISYKKGCLEKVVNALNGWENKDMVKKAVKEILEVHRRYARFSHMTADKAEEYMRENLDV
ncbi:MAG: HEAT repeat domain-containing protein [Candidatus Altiarchaeota archaeon]